MLAFSAPPESFRKRIRLRPHGTRARYVQGCRCGPCRVANRQGHQARERAKKDTVAHLPKPTGRCPGVHDQECPTNTKLYKNSGPVCERCRNAFAWNGLVDALEARWWLQELAREGVGLRAVEASTGIPRCILQGVRDGKRTRLRAQSARKIFAVDKTCISDGALVSATRAWRLLQRLLDDGYPARRLAKFLGYKGDAVQLGRVKMTARNALRVEKLYRWLDATDTEVEC